MGLELLPSHRDEPKTTDHPNLEDPQHGSSRYDKTTCFTVASYLGVLAIK